MFSLLTKILWLRHSKWQFLFAGFAFAFGLAIMLTAMEAYLQVNKMLEAQKAKGQFLMVNKKITLVNTLGLASSTFSQEEIDAIKKASFTKKMGYLESNKFHATIKARQYLQFSTVLFFESLPPAFLDEPNPEFTWHEGMQTVPIVISQDFLNLYNFGFALSRNLPQVSREAIKLVPFDVVVEGPGGTQTFEGKIVGFSERISSVLVPEGFMKWANRKIAQIKPTLPSRLILQVESISDPVIKSFLERNRMVTDQERLQLGKTGNILNSVMQVAALLGIVFLTLAFILFSTNFRLILAEAAADIKLLIELGYRHSVIRLNLISYFAVFLFLMFVVSVFVVVKSNQYVIQLLQAQGFGIEGDHFPITATIMGLCFTILVILFNGVLIIRHLREIA